MSFFTNDYGEGAHPRILEALARINYEHNSGYFTDAHCRRAAEMIKERIEDGSADIHFMVGGTITNTTAIAAWLRPYQAVIAAATGHISVHETGAIESSGHKVVEMECAADGKLTPELVEKALAAHESEHMVQPKLVYISDTTEVGTIYTKAELAALYDCCKRNGLYLYVDGARLGSALTAEGNDLTFADFAKLTDAFYIGGTKNGFLMGEALVIVNPALKEDFRFMIKQRGGMFAKGFLIGVQFEEMFRDDLYLELAAQTNLYAKKLREGIAAKGYDFMVDSPSNQQFPLFLPDKVKALAARHTFGPQSAVADGRIPTRLVCSWRTSQEDVDSFLADL